MQSYTGPHLLQVYAYVLQGIALVHIIVFRHLPVQSLLRSLITLIPPWAASASLSVRFCTVSLFSSSFSTFGFLPDLGSPLSLMGWFLLLPYLHCGARGANDRSDALPVIRVTCGPDLRSTP